MVQHGIILLINGPLIPSLMDTFSIGESTVGMLLAVGSIGFVMGPLIAGTIIDRVGIGRAFLAGFAIELLFFALFGLSPVFVGIVIANFMTRLGASFIETGGNVMPTLMSGKGSAHSRMNLVHVFFSVGAFLGPLLIGLYIGATGRWRPVLFFSMIPTVLISLWVFRSGIPRRPDSTTEKKHLLHDVAVAIRSRATLLGALSLMLYVGAEAGMSSWLVLYLQRVFGMNTVRSASGLSVMWVFIMIGRYLNSLAGNRFSAKVLVTVSGFGGCAGVIAFILTRDPTVAFILISWIGLCLSGVFPNIMAELNNREPERAGTVTAVMAIGASVGAALSQALVGAVAGAVSLQAAFLILGIFQALAVGTFFFALKPESAR
jgi:fucose permease